MNKIKIWLAFFGVFALAMGLQCAFGQSLATNFFGDLVTWSSSFNTNLTWTNSTLELYTGTVNYNNQNMEAVFGVRVNPWKGSEIGIEMNNVSALGTVSQMAGVVGYSLSHYDFRLTGEVAAGWRDLDNVGIVIPRIGAEKLMTANSAVKLQLGIPILTKGKQNFAPDVWVEATVIAW